MTEKKLLRQLMEDNRSRENSEAGHSDIGDAVAVAGAGAGAGTGVKASTSASARSQPPQTRYL
jgi:microcompartment protein CcmK/EutM